MLLAKGGEGFSVSGYRRGFDNRQAMGESQRERAIQDFVLRLQELHGSVIIGQLRKFFLPLEDDEMAF